MANEGTYIIDAEMKHNIAFAGFESLTGWSPLFIFAFIHIADIVFLFNDLSLPFVSTLEAFQFEKQTSTAKNWIYSAENQKNKKKCE